MREYFKKIFFINLFCLLLIFLDRLSKITSLKGGSFFIFNYSPNYNLIFGFIPFNKLFLYAIYFIILILILKLIQSYLKKETILIFIFTLIIAGALSNLFDRLSKGFVIDFIKIYFFPIFNIADLMIALGIFIWILKEFNLWKKKFI